MAGQVLAIDASNINSGGGLTHLVALLAVFVPGMGGFGRIVLWADRATLDRVADAPWLDKRGLGHGNAVARLAWLLFGLPRAARGVGAALIFAPGGLAFPGTIPRVTMSRNMLPFDPSEAARYGWSRTGIRLRLLRILQRFSFRNAAGVIFLTAFARESVQRETGPLARVATIPHGIGESFRMVPRPQRTGGVLTLVYVSIVDVYKHQWQLVRGAARLMQEGVRLKLVMIGPAYPPAKAKLDAAIAECDPQGEWVAYRGPLPAAAIAKIYDGADIGVFLSSCENMPNILLEMMAAGLPIVCSDRGPMPEILGEAGLYCDPERPEAVAAALRRLAGDAALREQLATRAHEAAALYSWPVCTEQTMNFLGEVARETTTCAA